jgi:thiol-disulfide isomerase/thioredoxin
MKKNLYLITLVLAIVAFIGGLATRHWLNNAHAEASATQTKSLIPHLQDLNGKTRNLSEWQGKIILINFWATWCSPCRKEIPELSRIQKEMGNNNLQIIGIAIDDADAVRDFMKHVEVNYPVLTGDEHTPEWAEQLGNKLAALPFSVVLDQSGKQVDAHMGILDREKVMKMIKSILPVTDH